MALTAQGMLTVTVNDTSSPTVTFGAGMAGWSVLICTAADPNVGAAVHTEALAGPLWKTAGVVSPAPVTIDWLPAPGWL